MVERREQHLALRERAAQPGDAGQPGGVDVDD
jgi:hypothetical protein